MSKIKAIQTFVVGTTDVVIQSLPDIPKFFLIKSGWQGLKVALALSQDLFPSETETYWNEVRNLTKLKSELVNSTEFKQAFINSLESFYKARSDKKRQLIKSIFLTGYLSSDDYMNFEIERFDEMVLRISPQALQHLNFLIKEIVPLQEVDVMKHIEVEQNTDTQNLLVKRGQKGINPLSKYLQEWIYKEYNISSTKYKKDPLFQNDIEKIEELGLIENNVRDRFTEYDSELISLGILRTVPTFDYQGYELTQFGNKFGTYAKSLTYDIGL